MPPREGSGFDPYRPATTPGHARPRWPVRLAASAALLAYAGTMVAVQLDFLRRHRPDLAPARYWLPQLKQIWLPGLSVAILCTALAFALHRRARSD